MFLSKKHIINFFKNLKIKKKDTVFLHGNSMALFQIKGENSLIKTSVFWNTLIEHLGKEGTIIVPTFTYSIGKKKIFNNLKSKSEVGQFSEDFRKYFSEKRSLDPIFSVGVYGKKKDIINKVKFRNSFGKNSIFDYMFKKNVKIICLGCELEVVTFFHYIEQFIKVPYRKFKEFHCYSMSKNQKVLKKKIKFFCRFDKSRFKYDLSYLKDIMLKKKKLNISKFGRIMSYSFNSKDFFNIGFNILKKNKKKFIYEI